MPRYPDTEVKLEKGKKNRHAREWTEKEKQILSCKGRLTVKSTAKLFKEEYHYIYFIQNNKLRE